MSDLEDQFEAYVNLLAPDLAVGMVREYRIVPTRKFRWDFAWPDRRVAVEVQGGIWSQGAHGRGSGILRDMEKSRLATSAGWRVLAFSVNHIKGDPWTMVQALRGVLEAA